MNNIWKYPLLFLLMPINIFFNPLLVEVTAQTHFEINQSLYYSNENRGLEIDKELISEGANVKAKNVDGDLALTNTNIRDYKESVQLFDKSADEEIETTKSQSWFLLRMFEAGLGLGTKSDVGLKKSGMGLLLSVRFLEFGYGFDFLGGIGVGTTVYEIMGAYNSGLVVEEHVETVSSHGLPMSFFPVNVYVPIVGSRKTLTSGGTYKDPSLMIEISGSKWASRSDYFRIGLSYDFGTTMIVMSRLPTPASFTIKAGIYLDKSYELTVPNIGQVKSEDRIGFYVYAGLTWGAIRSK